MHTGYVFFYLMWPFCTLPIDASGPVYPIIKVFKLFLSFLVRVSLSSGYLSFAKRRQIYANHYIDYLDSPYIHPRQFQKGVVGTQNRKSVWPYIRSFLTFTRMLLWRLDSSLDQYTDYSSSRPRGPLDYRKFLRR